MDIFTIENLLNLGVLMFLQAVLGFDNLLYISIESQRAPKEHQQAVRKWGILIAVVLRVVLLFVMMQLLAVLVNPLFAINLPGIITGVFNFSSIVFILGGIFLMYTAVKEITHILSVEDLTLEKSSKQQASALKVVFYIVLMNLIFSFDSILSAIAITKVFTILALAIITSGILMYLLADKVTVFIQNNKKYEVLGLFILLIVGIVLIGDGGHKANLELLGFSVEPISKATFYFSLIVLVIVDILQSKQSSIQKQKQK